MKTCGSAEKRLFRRVVLAMIVAKGSAARF